MGSLIARLRHISVKKWVTILILFAVAFFLVASFFRRQSLDDFFESHTLSYDYEDVRSVDDNRIKTYSALQEDYAREGLEKSDVDHEIAIDDMAGKRIGSMDALYGDIVGSYDRNGDTDVFLLDSDHSVTFTHPFAGVGLYHFAIDYYDFENTIESAQIDIRINGENPFFESQTIVLPAEWQFSGDFLIDRYGNDIQPSSEKIKTWRHRKINDYRGMHPGLFAFRLREGDVVEIGYGNSPLLIGNIDYVPAEDMPSYEDYLAEHGSYDVVNETINLSARMMDSRTEPSVHLRAEQDPSNLFYDTQFLKLNTIFGESWRNGGQAVTYRFTVPETGYYHVSFKYRQYIIKDLPAFRKIKVNGDVPFDLLESYAFPYTMSFLNRTLVDEKGDPLSLFFEEGEHTITLEAVNYPYRKTIETIRFAMAEIQSLALRIKRYTSGGTDRYRDWDIETYFPDAESDIKHLATLLEETYDDLLTLSDVDSPSEIGNLKVAASRLEKIAENINQLPAKMVQFSDGDSSVNHILGQLMQNLMRSNLELERTVIHGTKDIDKPYANIFVRLIESSKRLVLSFINNPYSTTKRSDNELMVWVNHPRQYIEIMQTLIDQKYPGMDVTLSQMPDQNKLILANTSGQAPDIAIGVDHWIPYEFAIREASLDLRQFSGYEDLVQNFTKGAIIPFVFEEGVYGLPGTQNFWVTFYRKDILESIGITDIPQTWEEIIAILPLLQSYGMNYYVPLAQFSGLKPFVATLPFIYQFGGDLYTEDGMQTNINSEETLEGIRLMSELFTLYNMPKFVGNFYNHFRYGMLPIGISDLSTYVLLQTAASELDGLWGMDLHPGHYDEEKDEIIRYSAVGSQSNMILSSTEYPEESFDFFSWWMSTEIQTEFAFLIQSTYGQQYFWNSANVSAFAQSPMPTEYKDVILELWEYGIEASRIPGNYMVEREISNAWTKIVFEGVNPRQALDEAVRISNREILYKMGEFGYTKDGVVIKPYTVPSIYNIDDWLTEVHND
jgi:ABC-type glycerol-3-phosphate transport system substrate-binding protein